MPPEVRRDYWRPSRWTAKDILGLERHGARTLHNLFVRIALRFAALAAAVALNHRLDGPQPLAGLLHRLTPWHKLIWRSGPGEEIEDL